MEKLQNYIFTIIFSMFLGSTSIFASASKIGEVDDGFLAAHPALPVENYASTLGDYEPKNDSQEEALLWARRIVDIEAGSAAGLWL